MTTQSAPAYKAPAGVANVGHSVGGWVCEAMSSLQEPHVCVCVCVCDKRTKNVARRFWFVALIDKTRQDIDPSTWRSRKFYPPPTHTHTENILGVLDLCVRPAQQADCPISNPGVKWRHCAGGSPHACTNRTRPFSTPTLTT